MGVSALLIYISPKPAMVNTETKIFYAKPLLLRAVSNISHTLVSDILWLVSAGMGELSGKKDTVEESIAIARNITVTDPYFFSAVHYYATYLASVKDAVEDGALLYETAGWFIRDDFRLIFNEMTLRLTYEEPLDNERVVQLAKRALALPQKMQYLGPVDFMEMVEGMMHYVASRQQRGIKKREDLLWLLENTTNPKRRREIQKGLNLIK